MPIGRHVILNRPNADIPKIGDAILNGMVQIHLLVLDINSSEVRKIVRIHTFSELRYRRGSERPHHFASVTGPRLTLPYG